MPITHELPQISLPSPILSLAGDGQGGVWAGGIGGVAHFAPGKGWTPYISGLPLRGVSALSAAAGWIFAGGVEGLSRSRIDSIAWELPKVEGKGKSIAAIALSPDFAQDKSALAATLEGGIFRTEDSGAIWRNANFGLQNFEITTLVWVGKQVLAGTASGLYRSPNEGRAWRIIEGSEGISFAQIVVLPDERLLTATDDGVLLWSADDGASWEALKNNLPEDSVITALGTHKKTLFLGTGNAGLWRSTDGGRKWKQVSDVPIFCIQASGAYIYAGTAVGLMGSADEGKTWEHTELSPLHDLRRIHMMNGQLIVSGGFSVALQYNNPQWQTMINVPLPLSLLTDNHQGRLVASGVDGLFISDDKGSQWQQVLSSAQGHLGHTAFRDDGTGWAVSADSMRLLRTKDSGATWEIAASPLGTDSVVALEASPELVFAATYNPLQQTARLWYSTDDAKKWQRGAEVRTPWAGVATYHQPPMVSLGGTILAQQSEEWKAAEMPPGANFMIRRILGQGNLIFALTTNGILVSHDNAVSFTWVDDLDLPVDQIMDFAVDDTSLYILSVDGRVSVAELETVR